MSTTSNIVKLNIGGTVFQTTKSTLTKYDGMFRGMFESGIPVETDESGCIFVDRDSKHFRLIVNFMRDGHVALPESVIEVEEICADASYFLLDGLIELCQPMIIQNNRMKKFRQIETHEKVVETVLHSTKPVLLIKYPTDVPLDYLKMPDKISEIEKLIDDYQDILNVYFLATKHVENNVWECYLYMDGKSIKIATPKSVSGYRNYAGYPNRDYEPKISERPELKTFVVAVKEDLETIFSGDQDKMKELKVGNESWRLRII